MDPNHWNTYNLPYSSSPGGLTPGHSSLNRLDLHSGLSLSHTLQATHGSLSSRGVSAIPGVNYSGLGMPLLDPITPLASGISGQAGHKALSLAQSQLVFDPQVRGNLDQPSSNVSRFDSSGGGNSSSKSTRSEPLSPRDAAVARTQILEAAAARVWGSSNPPASSLYNQFASSMSEVPVPTNPLLSLPSMGSHLASQKAELSLHNPPPAHSSGIPRVSTVQRVPHSSDPSYIRSVDNLVPSSLAHASSLYSSAIDRDTLGSNQQSSSLHRQTPGHIQHSYSSSREVIEDLSSNSQNPLYGSYANLTDAQDFTANQLSAGMDYEAVSPAPPINAETAQSHAENPSFPGVHFSSEFTNLPSQHPHNLSDKYQENDFRMKLESRLQQMNQEVLSFSQGSQERHDMNCLPKISKDLASCGQSLHTNHRSTMIQQPDTLNQALDIPHAVQTASANINHPAPVLQHAPISTLASLQQNQTKPPIQALADSTTKPKKRSRKKKDSIPASNTDNVKKSNIPHESLSSIQRQQIPQHSPNLISMPPSSHISTLSHPHLISQSSQQIQQQTGYNAMSGVNQFSSRDSHRAQTPSMPQNFSSQEHQGYVPAPSPKMSGRSNQTTVLRQTEFTMPSHVTSDKTGSYKQGQRNSKQTNLPDNSISQSQSTHLYASNIPESPLNMQNYPGGDALLNQGGQRDSPMQDIHSAQHISRLSSFTSDQSQQSNLASQLPRLNQQSPQGSIPVDSTSYSQTKLPNSSHYMTSNVLNSIQPSGADNPGLSNAHTTPQSPLQPSPVRAESTSIPRGYDNTRNQAMAEQQDTGQFQMDFSGQPFLEQLVGVPIASSNFPQTAPENSDVVFTTLGAASDSTSLSHQQQQQQSQINSNETYKVAFHEDAIHEVRPVATLTGNLGMGEEAFNQFFETQPGLDPHMVTPQNQLVQSVTTPAEPESMALTFVPQVADDDDFSHFSEEPQIEVKKEEASTREKSESFQESFLSYLQGNKQETLSSVSSAAITKRPQLPKYIPEPRRPKPPPPPPQSSSTPVIKECSIVVSDDEIVGRSDQFAKNGSTTQKIERDKDGYSVQRTSELAVKITLPKNKTKKAFNESALLSHNRKMKESQLKLKKRKGRHKDSDEEDYLPEEATDNSPETQVPRKPSPPPVRASIGRKAKEKMMDRSKKRKGYGESGSSTEEEPVIRFSSSKRLHADDSDQDYDSDKDPVWMPFDVDLKAGNEFDDKRKRPRRPRIRHSSAKSGRPPSTKAFPSPPSDLTPKTKPVTVAQPVLTTPQKVADENENSSGPSYTAGQFLIEKKDLQSYECYPIWRLEDGRTMIHKFELVVQNGVVKHKAVGTYSTWMKSMHSQFQPIKVKELFSRGKEAILVQVLEECRPKPPSDGKLILQYEDDPLVEQFNVYLQVFISQALEPNFLKTIIDRKEPFYVEALNSLDETIKTKLGHIASQARWTVPFKEALHKYPHMKEIDRPNLKQACQACENSSPPTIKSVVFSGHAYDKILLTDKLSAFSEAQEYMIGKTASYYVRPYHSLCHYKYWLQQRCHSKVKLMKESSNSDSLSDEKVLDSCLENRHWVLQLFDDLKKLLTFGDGAQR